MSILKGTITGAKHFFQAFSFIRKNKLAHYYIYPAILGLVVISAGFWSSSYYINELRDLLLGWLNIDVKGYNENAGFWENSKELGIKFGEWIVFFLVKLAVLYFLYRINKYIVLIFLAPVMAFLSERTEEIVSGTSYPFNMKQFLKDIWRGVLIATRNLVLEMLVTAGLLLLSLFVTPLSPFVAVALFIIGAYYYGFSTFDYLSERKKRSIKESIRYIKDHKWVVIGNGAMFSAFMLIPVVGTIFGPLNATVGAVLSDKEIQKEALEA